MPFKIIRDDITKVKADIIVNTANPMPIIGGGTDSAIYKAAGENQLLAERKKIGEIARGEAKITPAFDLPAKYIIHTVGPFWEGGLNDELETLKRCYESSLKLAKDVGAESIAFPLISTGVYGFPKDKALQIAVSAFSEFLMQDDVEMLITLVVFNDKAFRLSKSLFAQVEEFIDDDEVLELYYQEYDLTRNNAYSENIRNLRCGSNLDFKPKGLIKPIPKKISSQNFNKEEFMYDPQNANPFLKHFMEVMIAKDIDNKEVYKRANMNRKAFSKIICGQTKIPRKESILGLCIALKLTEEEAKDLLASASMAFNPQDNRDNLIIKCLQDGNYNLDDINCMLFQCNLECIGE